MENKHIICTYAYIDIISRAKTIYRQKPVCKRCSLQLLQKNKVTAIGNFFVFIYIISEQYSNEFTENTRKSKLSSCMLIYRNTGKTCISLTASKLSPCDNHRMFFLLLSLGLQFLQCDSVICTWVSCSLH